MEAREAAPKGWLVATAVACAGAFVFWWLARGPAPLDVQGVDEVQQAARTAQPARAPREDRGDAAIVAAGAGAASSEPSASEPVDDRPATVTEASERWLAFPRRKRTLARSFAFAATTQSSEVLVRHVELNPKDIELPQAKIDDLSKLVDECIARLKRAYRQHTDTRYALTNAAEAAGQLHELSPDSLSPKTREKVLARARFRYNRLSRRGGAPALGANEMPPAHFILTEMLALGTELVSDGVSARIRSGRLLVLRKPQAVGLENEAELLADAKRFFLYQVLAWSLDEGLIGVADSSRIAAEFEVWIRKV